MYIYEQHSSVHTEPLISNSTFDDLSCGSGESLVDYHTIYFKDVIFFVLLFYWHIFHKISISGSNRRTGRSIQIFRT